MKLEIEQLEMKEYLRSLDLEYYSPTGTYELYDFENDQWFNRHGQVLRNPEEYNPFSEGYTPFGDE